MTKSKTGRMEAKQDSSQAALLEVKSWLRKMETLSVPKQRTMQESQLKLLFNHACNCSAWWRNRLTLAGYPQQAGSLFTVLAQLPPLMRSDLQEHVDEVRAWHPDWTAKEIFTSTTSGSTGLPVRVEKFSAAFNLLYGAVSLIDHEWHGRDARLPLLIFSADADSVRPDWGSLFAPFQGGGCVTNRFTSNCSTEEEAALVLEHQPAYLKATAFRAAAIGEVFLRQGKIVPLRQIISQYERVTPRQREVCRKAFGAEIIDRYSCEECGWLALQCPAHEHLHVMAGTTIIEIVDEALNPCPPGVAGRVLVTSLQSYAMPIIRYDIGDIAEWGEECDCGIRLPVIKRLWGRRRNLVRLPDGEMRPMVFHGDDVAKIPEIREFRLVQQKNSDIDFFVRATRPLSVEEVEALRTLVLKIDSQLVVTVREVAAIDWGAGLKREEFVRLES